jgi:prepilin-type N-terminal cleavage/methylation domain-containing protein/prepilin-type processing-associated H-X9-DG protein
MRRQPEQGFTLIELLVVMAIITILAAILLPVLSSIRRKAQATECLSNVRQMAQATMIYCQDNSDYLPFAWYNDSNPEVNSFYSLLTPIMLGADFDGYSDFDQKIYTCPVRAREPLMGSNPMRISFGMNAFNALKFPEPRTRRLSVVQNPSSRVLIVDVAFGYNHPPVQSLDGAQVGYRHDGKANMLFFDGHVARYSLYQTNSLLLKFD